MTVINRAKFHHFLAKDTKVIDGGQYPPSQADSVLKRPGEIGLKLWLRIQRCTAVDFQGWLKMTLKIKIVRISIFGSRFRKLL